MSEETDGWCMVCRGRGGNITSQDPVGDGIGSESFFDPCPACIGSGLCPWCARELDDEECCPNEGCQWAPDFIDEPRYPEP